MDNFIIYLMAFVGGIIVLLWLISIVLALAGQVNMKDWAKRWSLRSLGLPQGSVRALIAFSLIFTLIFLIMSGVNGGESTVKIPDLPDWLIAILGTVIGFYFGSALIPQKQTTEEEEKGKEEKPKV